MNKIQLVRKHFSHANAFTLQDLKRVLASSSTSKNYIYTIIHTLLLNGELKKITRGVYTFRDDVDVVGFAYKPFYYGLQEALSMRGLWEQETNPVIITPRRVRTGLRTFSDRNYYVKYISRNMFFGFDLVKHNDFWIPTSDIEKTLMDFVYFREPLNAKVLAEIKKRINQKKLDVYLHRSSSDLKKRVKMLLKPNQESSLLLK